jgi:catechol 2,3-dioxygenase-like lactoylglutathione lyase family enzyme
VNDALVVFIYVEDLDRSSAFYGDALGLPMVLEQAHCRIYQASATGFVGVCRSGDRPTTPAGVIVTLVRDDVDEFCDRLIAAGIELEQAPAPSERFAIYHAFLRDPDGYLVEIQRFDDPVWAEPI